MVGVKSARTLTHWLPALGIVGVVLYFAKTLHVQAVNIPYADDIHDILLFLVQVSESREWTHTAELFFAQINEHRTLTSRLVYYLAYILQGEANFRTLVFLGNLGLLFLLIILYMANRHRCPSLLPILSAALILFQLRSFGTSYWSMNAFAFIYVYVYGFASLICLRGLTRPRLLAAILFASLATFTLASGQLIWLLGIAGIIHQVVVARRGSFGYLVAWMSAALVVLAVYRLGYEESVSITQTLRGIPEILPQLTKFFFIILGLAFTDNNVGLAVSAGAILLLVVAWSTWRRLRTDDITLELFAWYVIATLLVITLARVSAAAIADAAGILPGWITFPEVVQRIAFSKRFAFMSVLLLATTVLLAASLVRGRGGKVTAAHGMIAVLALVYFVSSNHRYAGPLQTMQDSLVEGHNVGRYWAFGDTDDEAGAIVREAEQLGIYRPPPREMRDAAERGDGGRPNGAEQEKE